MMLRKILLSLLLIIVLAVGGLFGLLATNSDIVIDRFHTYVENSTGAPLVMEARPEFTLFPNRGLELGAGAWKKNDGSLSISFSKATVLISSHALFSGRFSIKYFSVEDLDLTLRLKKPLREYLARLPERLENRRDLDEIIPMLLRSLGVAPDAIAIHRGKLCLIEPDGNILRLDPFVMNAKDVHPGTETDFSLHTELTMDTPSRSALLDLDCSAHFTSDKARLSVRNASFTPRHGFTFKESITFMGGVDYDLIKDSVALSRFNFTAPKVIASATGRIESLALMYLDPRRGDATVQLELQGDPRGLSELLHYPLPFADSDILNKLNLSTELRWSHGQLSLNSLQGKADAISFSGGLHVSFLPFTVTGSLQTDDLDLEAYRGSSSPRTPTGSAQRDFNSWPKLDIQFGTDHLRWDRLHLENMSTRLTGQSGTYEMNPLSAILAGSPVTASLKAVMLPTSPLSARLSCNLSIPQARLEDFSSLLLDQPVLAGTGALNASISFTTSRGLPSLSGKGSLTSSNARTNFSLLPASLPFSGAVTASNRFDRLMLFFNAKDGLVDISKCSLTAPHLKVSGTGRLNLPEKEVDASGSIQIAGTSAIPVKLSGSLRSPHYSLSSKEKTDVFSNVSIELDLDLPKSIDKIILNPH